MSAYISGTHHLDYDSEGIRYKAVKMDKEAFSLASVKAQGHALANGQAKIFKKTTGNLKEAKLLVSTDANYIPFVEYTIVFKEEDDLYITTVHAMYLDI